MHAHLYAIAIVPINLMGYHCMHMHSCMHARYNAKCAVAVALLDQGCMDEEANQKRHPIVQHPYQMIKPLHAVI